MANNALYFPYIDLPKNRFTSTALLYWDKVITIAPRYTQYELKPENHNDLLIRERAIEQIHPEDYSLRYPNFGRNFIKLIDDLELQRIYSKKGGWAAMPKARKTASKIHTGKVLTPDLYNMLGDRGLLIDTPGKWLMIEPITADLFMYYLALCLAQENTLECFPISDEPFNPARLNPAPSTHTTKKDDTRFYILDRLLPTSVELLGVEQILEIRANHHEIRSNFRKDIETFVNDELSHIPDPRERAAQIDNFIIRKREEIAVIQRQLQSYSGKKLSRIGWAALGFASAALAAVDLLHGGHFSSLTAAGLGTAGFGGSIIYAARNSVNDYREGAPELEKGMAFAALLHCESAKAPTRR